VEEARRARRGLSVLVAGEALAIAALHHLGSVDGFAIPRRDLARWVRDTPSEDVLLAGIRLAALIAAWWLLITTLLYVGARLADLNGAARAIGWVTVPAVRRWADRAIAVSVVAAGMLALTRSAAADPPPNSSPTPPPVVIDLDHRDRPTIPYAPAPTVRTGAAPHVELPLPPAPTTPPPAPATPPPAPATSPPTSARHVIAPGDHLWSIAARHLAASTRRSIADLTPEDIAPYWRRVVEHNRLRLRSGDPDLVYPGEEIELPPI
jgi:resuscitation-promoting factor RpfA